MSKRKQQPDAASDQIEERQTAQPSPSDQTISAQEFAQHEARHARESILIAVLSGLRFQVTKEEAPSSTAERITQVVKEIIHKAEAEGIILKAAKE